MSKDRALQFAQKELIRKPLRIKNNLGETVDLDASHPFYWAAF